MYIHACPLRIILYSVPSHTEVALLFSCVVIGLHYKDFKHDINQYISSPLSKMIGLVKSQTSFCPPSPERGKLS